MKMRWDLALNIQQYIKQTLKAPDNLIKLPTDLGRIELNVIFGNKLWKFTQMPTCGQ